MDRQGLYLNWIFNIAFAFAAAFNPAGLQTKLSQKPGLQVPEVQHGLCENDGAL